MTPDLKALAERLDHHLHSDYPPLDIVFEALDAIRWAAQEIERKDRALEAVLPKAKRWHPTDPVLVMIRDALAKDSHD